MRPKRSVLLVCPNEITASHLTVTIDVWGYRIVTIHDIDEAESALSNAHFDLVILMPGREPKKHEHFSAMAKKIEAIQTERGDQTRVFDSMKILPLWMPEGVVRITGMVVNAELLREGIRVAMARRIGPKKRPQPLGNAA